MNALVPANSSAALVPHTMNDAMRLAELMSTGKLVPVHLHRSPGDCLMVVEQAMRWGMSPFAVAQSTSVISGKLMFEGKLVAAAIQTSGVLAGRLSYDFAGDGDDRSITVRGTLRGETQPREIVIKLRDAKTNNAMWTKQPDQQLVYFGTRAWARRHTPEVMLGVYSPEEFDAPQQDTFTGTTIENAPEDVTITPPAAPEPRKPTVAEWLGALEAQVAIADRAELDRILSREDVVKAQNGLRNGALDRLNAIFKEALDRLATPPAEAKAAHDALLEDDVVPF